MHPIAIIRNGHLKSHNQKWPEEDPQLKITTPKATQSRLRKNNWTRQDTTRHYWRDQNETTHSKTKHYKTGQKNKAWQSTTTQGQTNRVKEHQQEITTPEASIRQSHPKNHNQKLAIPAITTRNSHPGNYNQK